MYQFLQYYVNRQYGIWSGFIPAVEEEIPVPPYPRNKAETMYWDPEELLLAA